MPASRIQTCNRRKKKGRLFSLRRYSRSRLKPLLAMMTEFASSRRRNRPIPTIPRISAAATPAGKSQRSSESTALERGGVVMEPGRLLDPGGGGVYSVYIRSGIFPAGTRSSKGWCLLTVRPATMTQSIIPVLPALKIFHYRGRIAGIEVSRGPSLRRTDKDVPRHSGICEALAHDTRRALCTRLERAIRRSAPGWEYFLFSHSNQVVRELKIRDLLPVHSYAENEKSLRWEGCVVNNANVAQCRHHRTHLRKRAKPIIVLTANVIEYIVVNAVTLSSARGTARIRQSRAHGHPARHMADGIETNDHIRGLADGTVVLLVLRR